MLRCGVMCCGVGVLYCDVVCCAVLCCAVGVVYCDVGVVVWCGVV